jgi:hypothetical protein
VCGYLVVIVSFFGDLELPSVFLHVLELPLVLFLSLGVVLGESNPPLYLFIVLLMVFFMVVLSFLVLFFVFFSFL